MRNSITGEGPQTLTEFFKKTVVINTFNYYPGRDGLIKEVDEGKPKSVLSKQIGQS